MPLELQVTLLRVLQERKLTRIGDNKLIPIDLRIICATNKDLAREVEQGNFRQDLYYRINVMKLELPPLRQRREDIPLLIQHFINAFNALQNKNVCGLSPDALALLCAYNYPGNVRELQNIIEHAFMLTRDGRIELDHLPSELVPVMSTSSIPSTLLETMQNIEARAIREAIERHNGNRLAAAKELGMHKSTLFRKVQQLGIELPARDGRSRHKTMLKLQGH
jgi:transcriptional regulator with PAS, ATPase and Fis domain